MLQQDADIDLGALPNQSRPTAPACERFASCSLSPTSFIFHLFFDLGLCRMVQSGIHCQLNYNAYLSSLPLVSSLPIHFFEDALSTLFAPGFYLQSSRLWEETFFLSAWSVGVLADSLPLGLALCGCGIASASSLPASSSKHYMWDY